MLKTTSIILISVSLFYLTLTFLNKLDKDTQLQDQIFIGSFQLTDSPSVILNLLPGHSFILENKISEKYYGDGNWEAKKSEFTKLTLDFENGESLDLSYFPGDSSLNSEKIENLKWKLRRIATRE